MIKEKIMSDDDKVVIKVIILILGFMGGVLFSMYVFVFDFNESVSILQDEIDENQNKTNSTLYSSKHLDNENVVKFSSHPPYETGLGIIYKGNLTPISGVGKSMLPSIPPYSIVLMDYDFDISNIRNGDIVEYNSKGDVINTTIHRVVWMNDTHFMTKGDTNLINDDIESNENIMGVVVGVLY